jgi:hypothetical protein
VTRNWAVPPALRLARRVPSNDLEVVGRVEPQPAAAQQGGEREAVRGVVHPSSSPLATAVAADPPDRSR